MSFDDHRVPRRAFEEIEAEADRCRSFAQPDQDGRIDVFELLSALRIKLAVKSDADMVEDEAYSLAGERQICCRRSVSKSLRFGDPHSRYLIGHELGHMFLHRGSAPKPRKLGGNKDLAFIEKEESAERQAWMFARALFVTRLDLTSGESDEELGIRVGIGTGPVTFRRHEVQEAMQALLPKAVPHEVISFLENARRLEQAVGLKRDTGQAVDKLAAWERAGQIWGKNPAEVRSARGWQVEWNHYGHSESQVGWTVLNGEVRSFMDLRSR